MSTSPTTTTIAGRYELAERIASGGSGSVWLARDDELGRQVAVKLVPIAGDLTDDERADARTRVVREARAAARLRHPAIATVFDIVSDDDHVAIVMAYIDAPNLRQRVSDDGPLTDEQATAIGRQVVEVLAAAHAAGVVHRDVKPSNVLVSDSGAVKLADFGIASVGDETRLTRTGATIGSPSYLAPEQARGEPPTPAADLWGLGATLYFALTGSSPFDRGTTLASLHATLSDEPPELDRDSTLWPLITGLLVKDPERRLDLDAARDYLRDPEAAAAAASSTRTATLVLPPDAVAGTTRTADPATSAAGASVFAGSGPAVDPEADDASSPRRGRFAAALVAGVAVLAIAVAATLGSPSGTDDSGEQDVAEQPETTDAPAPADDGPADEPPTDAGGADAPPGDAGDGPGKSNGKGKAKGRK